MLTSIVVKTYKGKNLERQYREDAARLSKQGYKPINTAYSGSKKAGCLGWLAFGAFNFARSSKPTRLIVTYSL